MSGSVINPPNTALIDAAGRATPEFYRFLVALQKDTSDTVVSLEDVKLLTGSITPAMLAIGGAGGGTVITTGAATIDFGAFPGANETSVTVSDTNVVAGSVIKAWFMSDDSTADHTAADHKYAPTFINLTAEPDAGVGLIIYARSEHKMQGQWLVNWEYN